jgi:hypothetical protein
MKVKDLVCELLEMDLDAEIGVSIQSEDDRYIEEIAWVTDKDEINPKGVTIILA